MDCIAVRLDCGSACTDQDSSSIALDQTALQSPNGPLSLLDGCNAGDALCTREMRLAVLESNLAVTQPESIRHCCMQPFIQESRGVQRFTRAEAAASGRSKSKTLAREPEAKNYTSRSDCCW